MTRFHKIVLGHFQEHRRQVIRLNKLKIESQISEVMDEAFLHNLGKVIEVMRYIGKIRKLELDFRDFEYLSVDGFFIHNQLITFGAPIALWSCQTLVLNN